MFSVVIPLYNKGKYIKKTIDSVLAQTFPDFEIIVVNDSSTDNGRGIVESYEDDRVILYNKQNEGVSEARNFGISKATHPFIAFLDADDIWLSNYLQNIYELIIRYPEAGIYASSYFSVNNEGCKCVVSSLKDFPKYSIIKDYFKYSYYNGKSLCITSAICVKKTILQSRDLFRKGIGRGEDIDLGLRICLTLPVAFCNEPMMLYSESTPNSLSANYTSIDDEFPYLEWLNYRNESPFFKKYVVLVIYMAAKNAFLHSDYQTCYAYLLKILKISPSVKSCKRLFLLFCSFLKI